MNAATTYHDAKAMVAQCLASMAEEPQQATGQPQCEAPVMTTAVSGEEDELLLTGERQRDIDHIREIPMQYSHDNMISTNDLPAAGQWGNGNHSVAQCTTVWNTKMAATATRELDLLESILPHDRKENALKLFHENNYQINGILDTVMQEEPAHGMNWSPETKEAFVVEIKKKGGGMTKKKKNFAATARTLNKKAGNCQAYYYSSFKCTHEYAKMKRALKRSLDRQIKTRSSSSGSSSSIGSGECERCKGYGELLCCDICEKMYHLRCVKGLDIVPDGNWFCEECDVQRG